MRTIEHLSVSTHYGVGNKTKILVYRARYTGTEFPSGYIKFAITFALSSLIINHVVIADSMCFVSNTQSYMRSQILV